MKFLQNKEGRIVVLQKPNAPLVVGFLALVPQLFQIASNYIRFFEYLSFGAFFTWAWLELFEGDSPFRRVLGFCVLVYMLISRA